MGDSDILCESCAYINHTNLQSCMSIFSDTLHDHHISEESLRDSKLPVTGYLRTKGYRSQCMQLVLVSFTLFYSTSYMYISIVSHFTVMFARDTCAL